jgi:hypothetical protein
MRQLIFFFIFIAYGFQIQAAPAKAQVPVSQAQPQPQKLQPLPVPKVPAVPAPAATSTGIKFGMDIDLRYSTQAEKQPDGTRSEYITYEFIPAIKTEDYRFRLISDFYYHVKDQSINEWDNTVFEATTLKPWSVSPYVDLKPDLIVALPFFQRSSDFRHYYGARMTAALVSKNTSVPELTLRYGLQYGKFGFKQDMTAGAYNIDSRLRQRVHLGYQFTEAFAMKLYFHFDSNFLIDNTVRNTYYHETIFEYTFNDVFGTYAGIANGGGLYKGEYQEQDNLNFYDKNTTEAIGGITFSF